MSYQTTVSNGSPFGLNYYVFTDERPYWEINDGRLDIFVGDMEAVHTSREGTWIAVTVVEVTDEPEEEDLPDLDEADLIFDAYFAKGQLANENARGVMVHHVPTDIAVQCGSEKSQLQNKVMALRLLQIAIKASG